MLDRVAGRVSGSLLALILSGHVFAVGLGDMRGQPVLGESIRLEVALLGAEKQKLDATCFRLVQPLSSDGLPWLRKANMAVRGGASPVLEIRTELPLREPVMQLTLQLGCGHEISRDYILMASPATAREAASLVAPARAVTAAENPGFAQAERRAPRVRAPVPAAAEEGPAKLVSRKSARRTAAAAMPDRLVLSGDDGVSTGEPSLRLATELRSSAVAKEAQRDILRLEFRMLMALHEQAASQMATAEKLRNMEGTLVELQARAEQFAQRVEKEAVPAPQSAPAARSEAAVPRPDSVPVREAQPRPSLVPATVEPASDTPWTLYGLALGVLLGLAGWFGWRKYREAGEFRGDSESDDKAPLAIPEVRIDPKRFDEQDEPAGVVDLHVEPVIKGAPAHVDLDLDLGLEHPAAEVPQVAEPPAEIAPARGPDSVLSINATTLDEHFEANPVMELADIMLSFGRVKGAAQALQEFIDHNPEEALRPWIRLMDVYRMAGMRTEFENVARDLNRHFNVEVQRWDGQAAEAARESAEIDQAIAESSRSQSLEEMSRLMNTVVAMWGEGDVVGYLYQLLRDNRGGQRQGFALPVVEDIMFLIELKETANRME